MNEDYAFNRGNMTTVAQFNYDTRMIHEHPEIVSKIKNAAEQGQFEITIHRLEITAEVARWLMEKDFDIETFTEEDSAGNKCWEYLTFNTMNHFFDAKEVRISWD